MALLFRIELLCSCVIEIFNGGRATNIALNVFTTEIINPFIKKYHSN